MKQIYVVYWSGTGCTASMANYIGEGIESAGYSAQIISVSDLAPTALKDQDIFAMGCPAMGAEVLEETEMEPFVSEIETFCAGKKIALFGSYGWGDGEWMRDWEIRMQNAGAELISESIISNGEPDAAVQASCKALGVLLTSC